LVAPQLPRRRHIAGRLEVVDQSAHERLRQLPDDQIQMTYDVCGHLFPSLEDDHAKLAAGELAVLGTRFPRDRREFEVFERTSRAEEKERVLEMGIVVEKPFHVMPRARTRYKRCYEPAGMGIIEPGAEEFLLVHSTLRLGDPRSGPPLDTPHAWLLDPSDDTVCKPVLDLWIFDYRRVFGRRQAHEGIC
jgi:hypothetical protein